MLKKWDESASPGFTWQRVTTNGGLFERCNELSGSIKYAEFINYLDNY
jgi:hypothetical protein